MSLADPHVAAFEAQRGLLTGVSHAGVRERRGGHGAGGLAAAVESPRSWLLTVVSRLSLDRLKSARTQREQYYGTWLPEPLVGEAHPAPGAQVDASVSIALLLEKLSPMERAGFLLHDVFGYTFDEIGRILDQPAVNCRKLVSRARERVRAEKPRFSTTNRGHEQLLTRFLAACRAGELEPLMEMLSDSATLHADGGGKVSAVPTVLAGREAIAHFFLGISRTNEGEAAQSEASFTIFNGAPGLLLSIKGHPVTAMSLEIRDGKIAAIFAQRNPDKLRVFA